MYSFLLENVILWSLFFPIPLELEGGYKTTGDILADISRAVRT